MLFERSSSCTACKKTRRTHRHQQAGDFPTGCNTADRKNQHDDNATSDNKQVSGDCEEIVGKQADKRQLDEERPQSDAEYNAARQLGQIAAHCDS